VRFTVADELVLFAGSVRAAVSGWEPPREPDFGEWLDGRDHDLAARVAAAGWGELWAGDELLGPAVAGGIELGRAAAPACLVDDATLGAPLSVDGRARHARNAGAVALPVAGGGLALGRVDVEPQPEMTLDDSGTVRVDVAAWSQLDPDVAAACWRAWNAATLGYLAGLAERALELAVEHARAREQFGAAIASLPAVQARLADAALAADSLRLLAWAAEANGGALQEPELRFAGSACCEVTASAHQVHGALGFALETGLHVFHRRARSVSAWAAAACSAARL
jgi:hypothetical protein